MTRRNYAFALAEDLIMAHLRTFGPATIRDLAEDIGKGKEATRKAVHKLHAERRIYVKDWPIITVQRAALWAARTRGQEDAPKPGPRSPTELKRNWARKHAAVAKARRSVRVAKGNPFAMLMN